MDTVYKYENYREFLKDYFSTQKEQKKNFTQKWFAKKCGFSSHSYCRMIIKGERNLSKESVEKIASAIPLKERETQYFKTLVEYQHTEDIAAKELLYKKLNILKKHTKHYNLKKEHIKYFNKWYYPVIRHIAIYAPWNGDYSILASLVIPKITKEQAKQAVSDLISMGLLHINSAGDYCQSEKVVSAEKIPPFFKLKARKEVLEKGIEAAENFDSSERYTAYTTLTFGEKSYTKATCLMDELRKNLIDIALDETKTSRVYKAILQLFPVSVNFNPNNTEERFSI